MEKLLPAKPSEKEIQEGAPLRKSFRDQVIINKSTVANAQPIFKDLNVESQSSKLLYFIEKELSWLNANVEVTKRQIETRGTSYGENIQTLVNNLGEASIKNISNIDIKNKQEIINKFPFTQFKDRLSQSANAIQEKNKEEKIKINGEIILRTTWDIAWSAIKTAAFWAFIAFFILLSLRAAGFNANETLWRPLSYRILNFIYTFLFGFIWVPYYTVWEIKAIIDSFLETKNGVQPPIWYSLFPIKPYIPSPPIIDPDTKALKPSEEAFDFNKLLFGYPDTDEIREWIKSKCAAWNEQQSCALKSTVLENLIAEAKIL
jgi:hypothetical protein